MIQLSAGLWYGKAVVPYNAAQKCGFNFKSLQITAKFTIPFASNMLLTPRHRVKLLRNGNLAMIISWTKLPSDLHVHLQQYEAFELWILFGGRNCSVSETQWLNLWGGQNWIGSSHSVSPVHTVKAQFLRIIILKNSPNFNIWLLLSSVTAFWPQEQANKQLLMRLELSFPQQVNIRTGEWFGT